MIFPSTNKTHFWNLFSYTLIYGVLLLFTLSSCSKKTSKSKTDFNTIYNTNLSDSITNILQPLMESNFKENNSGMVAITVFIKEQNTILTDTSFYFSNNSMPLPNDSTLFQLGSVTKTFTAALIAKQINSGAMTMDAPAQNFLPEGAPTLPTHFNGKPVTITLGQLTTMNSGLQRDSPVDFSTKSTPYPYAFSYLNNNAKLVYKPGSACNLYSNLGFGIAGLTLSHQAHPNKKDYYNYYEQVVIDSLLTPIKMNDTRITLSPSQLKRRALPYAKNGTKSTYNNVKWPMNLAAGGLYSTITDMQKYSKNMIGEGSFITSKDIDTLLLTRGKVWVDTCAVSKNHYKAKQGMAWVTNRDMKTYNGVSFDRNSKDGGLAGFSTYITLTTPEINGKQYKAYVVTLANKNKFPVQNSTKSILQLLFNSLPQNH